MRPSSDAQTLAGARETRPHVPAPLPPSDDATGRSTTASRT